LDKSSNNIWWSVQIMGLLIMQYPPPSYHFIPLRSKYSPYQSFSNAFNLCPSHNARDLVSHTNKTTRKIVLYISKYLRS
jgi:hypothetical protein